MSTHWPRCALTLLLCACERAPNRLEQASQQINAQEIDADIARGRAAMEALKPQIIELPPRRPDTEYTRVSLVVSAAAGALDPETDKILSKRLRKLHLVAAVKYLEATLTLILVEAPRARLPEITAALGAQGRLQIAHLPTKRRREDLRLDDPAIRWTPLPVEGIEVNPSIEELSPTLTAVLTPAGQEALAQATGQGGYIALAFDDLVLGVIQVMDKVPGGKLTLRDYAQELGDPRGSIAVIAAALASPSLVPLKVDVTDTEDFPACPDPANCDDTCKSGSPRACLKAAEARTQRSEQLAALEYACTAGESDACTQLCTRGDEEHCLRAIMTLRDLQSIWSDVSHAATLAVERCRKGYFHFCAPAQASLLFGPLGEGDFITVDDTLRAIGNGVVVTQANALRQYMLDQARELCQDFASPVGRVGACLFVAKALTDGELAERDQAAIDDALRRAGEALR